MYIRKISFLKKCRSESHCGVTPVIVEMPLTWLESTRDGQQHREMFSTLLSSINQRSLRPLFKPTYKKQTFSRRRPPKAGITLSYHSVGNTPFVWHIKETPIKNYYSFDRYGFSGWSEICCRKEQYRELIQKCDLRESERFVNDLRSSLSVKNESKYKQSDLRFNILKDYVFFPLQLLDDLVAKFYNFGAVDALNEAIRLAESLKINLVVKRHPYCSNKKFKDIEECSKNLEYVTFTNASIHKILPNCRSMIVANSGVGLEGLMYRVPVYSFAKSEYELAAHNITHRHQISEAFRLQNTQGTGFSDKFLYHYLSRHCFNINDEDSLLRMIDRSVNERHDSFWI